jgi:hypothetical protein
MFTKVLAGSEGDEEEGGGKSVLDYVLLIYMGARMELQYTYWQEKDGWFLGYLNDYPEHSLDAGKNHC